MPRAGDRRILLTPMERVPDASGGSGLQAGTPMEAWATRRDRGGRERLLAGGSALGGNWTREYEFVSEPYQGLSEDWTITDESGVELEIESIEEAAYAPRTMVVVRCIQRGAR